MPSELTLEQLEAVVDRGLGSYREGGEALTEIRDRVLYEGGFAEYVRSRFGMSRGHAYRLIEAAVVAKACLQLETPAPANELQCRMLAQTDDPASWWQYAREQSGVEQPTATQIEQAVFPSRRQQQPIAPISDVLRWLVELRAPIRNDGVRMEQALGWYTSFTAHGGARDLQRELWQVVRYFTAYAEQLQAAPGSRPPATALSEAGVQEVMEQMEAAMAAAMEAAA